MTYVLLNRYILTDLITQLHITDLKTGESYKRTKIAGDNLLLQQATKII